MPEKNSTLHRVVQEDVFYTVEMESRPIITLLKKEKEIMKMIKNHKVVNSDNLVDMDFFIVLE